MKTAGLLIALSIVTAFFASGLDRTSVLWAALVWLVVASLVAALVRVHATVNAPAADE